MVRIVVTTEQAKLLTNATESVEVVDAHGNRLGFFARPFDVQEEIRIARQRLDSNEPRYTTNQVLDHLKSLEQK